MNTFKKGDKVRRKPNYINDGGWVCQAPQILTVIGSNPLSTTFEEIAYAWITRYFELVESAVNVYDLLDTEVYYKKGGSIKKMLVREVRVNYHSGIHLVSSVGDIIDHSDVIEAPKDIIVDLNKEYSAKVTEDSITVGCQTFPISIIDDLVKARESLHN